MKRKHFLSLLMTLLLAFSLVTVSASAAENEASVWQDSVDAIASAEPTQEQIDLSVTAPSPDADVGDHEFYEVEPNNSEALADRIYNDYTVHGSVSSTDLLDYYKFTLSSRSEVTIVSSSASSTLVFGIWDTSDDCVAASLSLGYSDGYYGDALTTTLSAGTYYVVMMPDNQYRSASYIFYIEWESLVSAPSAPTSISVSNSTTTGKPTISWSASSGATYYEVYRNDTAEGTYTRIGTTSSLSYTDSSAVAGETWYYTVCAGNSAGESRLSSYKVITVDCAKPTLTGLTIRAWDGKPAITWDSVDGADTYDVYRSTNGGKFYKQKSVTATTYVDASAAAGKTYTYKIKAVPSANPTYGVSAFSNTLSATADCARPSVTGSVNSSSNKPVLTWKVVSGATSYQVYRSTTKGSGYSLITTTSALNYTDTTAAAGTTYYYKVHAVNSANTASRSSASFITTVTTNVKLVAPTVSIANHAATGKPTLSWNAVTGANKYIVYRSATKGSGYTAVATTSSLTYLDSSATAGVICYYKVHAVNDSSRGPASAVKSITPDCARPAISSISTRAWDGYPVLSWNSVAGSSTYEVWRSTNGGSYAKVASVSAQQYVDFSAVPGNTYSYKVRAMCDANVNGASAFSVVKSIVADCARPTASIAQSDGVVQLSWNAVADADAYIVTRSVNGGAYAEVVTTSSLSYMDIDVISGNTYSYKIQAVNSTNVESASSTSFIKTVTID